jgi:hypothetical protein
MDKCFIIWNERSLYIAPSIIGGARKLSKYKLDLVGAEEVKRDELRTKTRGIV